MKIFALTCIAAVCAFAAHAAAITSDRGALWKVVEACAANYALLGASFPCLDVHLSEGEDSGYVVLRPPVGKPDTILAPTRKIVGVEDAALQSADAPNYFETAWQARKFLAPASRKPLEHDDVALALNSRFTRTQDQLHIHIGCTAPQTRAAVKALLPNLNERAWMRIERPIHGLEFWGRLIARDTLAGANPIRLAAQGFGTTMDDPANLLIVVVGVRLADDRDGFVVLAAHNEPAGPIRQVAAEDLLDSSCSS